MRSTNPAMAVVLNQAGSLNFGGLAEGATLAGTTTKSILLVLITMIVGYGSMIYSLNYMLTEQAVPNFLLYGSIIASLVLAFVTIFKPQAAPVTAPLYAITEGAGLGTLSMFMELKYPGIVSTAVMSTFVVVLTMLALWKFRIIVPTARMRSIITGATCGVAVLYLLNLLTGFFGFNLLPSTGPLSILISLVICTIAAFNLVLDFENIQQSVEQGLPKYFEYFNAFSLLVTICWLYIEILNLLSKRE